MEGDSDNSDNKLEMNRVSKATDMALCLFEICNNLKKNINHSLDNLDDSKHDKYDILDLVFDKIHDELENHNIRVEELII